MFKKINVFFLIGFVFIFCAAALTGYNFYCDYTVGKASESILSEIDLMSVSSADSDDAVPDYILDPDMPMPTKTVGGYKYVGVLEIPSLSLKLPVIETWSYDGFLKAPCVYYGSAYKDNLVIAAHNYTKHFGRLKNLLPGNTVIFTDVDGNCFNYNVLETQILQPNEIKEMTQSDADLTLFTCTVGGRTRVTVRCERAEDK